MTVRVLVVDDQPQLRTLVRRFFALSETPIEVVAEAASAAEAREALRGQPADVAVIDANLPDGSGLDLAAELRDHDGDLRVILFTGYVDRALEEQADAAGIAAVVSKDEVSELGQTVVAVMAE